MPIRQRFDRFLLAATILQVAVGLAVLGSASWVLATERYGQPGSYFFPYKRKGKEPGQDNAVPGLEDGKEGDYQLSRLDGHPESSDYFRKQEIIK